MTTADEPRVSAFLRDQAIWLARVTDPLNKHVKDLEDAADYVERLEAESDELRQWINDLQAGMYINCVYCGHRYGPDDEIPATMAGALKEHVERCPKHPMSALKIEKERLEAENGWLFAALRADEAWESGFYDKDTPEAQNLWTWRRHTRDKAFGKSVESCTVGYEQTCRALVDRALDGEDAD